MSYPLKRIAAIFLLGGFAFHAGAQIMTEAEARAHTQRVEGGWKAVQVGDSAHSVEQKMGRPGSIIKENGQDNYFVAKGGNYKITFTINAEDEGRILTIDPQ